MSSPDRGEEGLLPLDELPANVFVGPEVTIRGPRTFARYRSEKRPGVLIGARSELSGVEFVVEAGGRVEIGEGCRLRGVTIVCSGEVLIENEVSAGPGVTIEDGVRVGRGAVLEEGSVVRGDVPAGKRVRGSPARVVGE